MRKYLIFVLSRARHRDKLLSRIKKFFNKKEYQITTNKDDGREAIYIVIKKLNREETDDVTIVYLDAAFTSLLCQSFYYSQKLICRIIKYFEYKEPKGVNFEEYFQFKNKEKEKETKDE